MESLPTDVLSIIFAYMPTEILGLCASVCKIWNNTCWKSHSALQLPDAFFARTNVLESFGTIVRKCTTLKSWEFSKSRITNIMLQSHASYMSRLTSLHLVNCPHLSTPILMSIAENCKLLQELNIKDSKRILQPMKLDMIVFPPTLLSLNIEGNSNTNVKVITKIVQTCKSLRVLRLKGCYKLTDTSVKVILEGLPDLEVLGIEGLKNISKNSFGSLANITWKSKLKELDMRMCDKIDNDVIEIIGKNCTNVKVIILKFCKLIDDRSSSFFSLIPILHLDLQGTSIGDEGVKTICSSSPTLDTLDLRDCESLGSTGYCNIAEAHGLRFLRLRSNNVDDVAALTIARECKQLKVLDLEGCVNISDSAIEELKECKHLSRLSLKNIRQHS